MLQLERQQDFINLAGVAFFCRQVNIAGDLHRDGGRALAFCPAQIGQCRPHHAQVIHAAMREKARIFNRQHRIFHDLRNFVDWRESAALLTELSNKHLVRRVNSQWLLRTVVGQR